MEAIDAGIPLYVRHILKLSGWMVLIIVIRICWPFGADQPINTIHLTENLDVAYELLEVRTGEGLKPLYRTGQAPAGTLDAVRAETITVLENAFGEDGARKRANIQKLKEASLGLWDEGGASRLAAEQLLDSLS